jgi:hypothetical protein
MDTNPELDRAEAITRRLNRTLRDLGVLKGSQELLVPVEIEIDEDFPVIAIELSLEFVELDHFAALATALEQLAERVTEAPAPQPGPGQGSFEL